MFSKFSVITDFTTKCIGTVNKVLLKSSDQTRLLNKRQLPYSLFYTHFWTKSSSQGEFLHQRKPLVMHVTRNVNNWRRQMEFNDKRRKVIPRLVYLHNPWKYFVTKMNIWKLMIFWDFEFDEREFIRGSTQAAVVLTNIIRTQDASNVSRYTTPIGFQQITRDMLLSREDARLKLVKFDAEHIRRAIPMKVARRSSFGRKYCFIDMLFVGLRNTKDFDTPEEVVEINEVLRKLDADLKTPIEVLSVPHRIVFAEIFIRFRRDYSERGHFKRSEKPDPGWSVSFYKILTFDVLNYDPKA